MKIFFILFVVFASQLMAQQKYEQVVYLKNGSVIRGTIILLVPNVSVKIETKDRNVFVFEMDKVLKITKESFIDNKIETIYPTKEDLYKYKSISNSILLSFLFPGAGQYYNGDVGKGILMNALYIGGWVLYFTSISESYNYTVAKNECGVTYIDSPDDQTNQIWLSVGIITATSIWSIVDAAISTSNHNERIRKKRNAFGHMFEINTSISKNKILFGFDIVPKFNGIYSGLTLHF